MATQSKSALVRTIRSIALLTTTAAVIAVTGVTAAMAATVTLKVISARTEANHTDPVTGNPAPVSKGDLVTTYKYLINVDNTGTTTQRSPAAGTGCSPQDVGYPNTCLWTSIAGAKGSSPIATQGTQADFAPTLLCGTSPCDVPDGRYLISVLADGYKLDGRHFTVSGSTVTWQGKAAIDPASEVMVELQPWPLPDAQIQAAVFEDISPVNSAPDLPAEHGLAGFQAHITDYLGEVTTDVYGAPLCGTGRCVSACYVVNGGVDIGTVAPVDAAGRCPTVAGAGFPAGAVVEGKVKIPNLGPNRYALSVTPPDGSGWIQTTTLEGNHDWDAWVMEGATGLDTEFVVAGEPFPAIIFGYVPAPGTPSAVGSALPSSLTGSASIKGVVDAVKIYVPTTGGVPGLPGQIWGGLQGAKIDKPIPYPWVSLTNLGNGDTVVWVGRGDVNGNFTIPNVPAGTYTLTWWDEPQNTILDLVNITVGAGETVDMGILPLAGWWTFLDGYVFNDTNRNGVKDAAEPGLAGYTLTMRKRENSLMDRGTTFATTDANGYYKFEAAYPMTQWLVMEAYDDLHYSTGVTYQADNQPMPTTVLGAGVDVSVHPIIGLSGRMDWGKHTYDATGANGIDPRNGGIVGTVTYDTTRNELDPRYAAVEDWQPSIPNLTMRLYAPVACTTAPCDASGRYALDTDGSYKKGNLLNTYLTETWQRPKGCIARDVDGNPIPHGTGEQVLSTDDVDGECIEAPMLGIQFATYASDQDDPAIANFGATVDGNYGFGDGCFNGTLDATDPSAPICNGGEFTVLPAGDYLVEVAIPDDATGRPMYKVTREEDINIGNGDEFFPPAVPPSACAGPMHMVDSSGNANFPGGPGTSPYEGTQKPLCNVKLVTLSNGKSIAPAFNLFTDVPIPGRHWFIIIDDLNFSSNPKSITFGEKAGMPFVPVGIYDWTDRLITTVESDYNGLADVLLPSTNRINCPTPSGVCGNLYRYVGNDPGVPGRLNLNYNPMYRTIAAEFEILPGLIVPADLAVTQVGVSIQLPGAQTTSPLSCTLNAATPQIYAVSVPYANVNTTSKSFTISGTGFGATKGSGAVTLNGVALPTTSWSNTQIAVNVPTSTAAGPQQLMVAANNGQSTVNGLTFHVLKGSYNPQLYEVGPGRTYAPVESLPAIADHAIQRALDAAPAGALVVVYPNNPSANPRQNPRGAYYENLIISKRVKLQGVGPGSPDGSVRGSIIDGGAFGGDSPVATDWYGGTPATTGTVGITGRTWAGNQTIYDGAVISLFLPSSGTNAFPTTFSASTAPSIDGFDLRGGDQAGFPGNINVIGGGPTGLPGGLITQGGAIFANGYARNLQITNNVVQNNGGAYGTIRIGTPDLPAPDTNNHNEGVRIANNRIFANAGTNLAGGIGLFNGADNYEVAKNDVCGNFSSEYGGGISALGYSPNGRIHDNRIYFNQSFDEGGGIMIAGALPANTTALSPGSGPVDIYNNLIQANLSNDDGGGIRFLMAGNFPMNVYNNFIVNNVSTHEGGGIALNDTPDVRFYNNTVMKNLTTATAVTSNGNAAPAGLSTSMNSVLLQGTLPGGSPLFSNPLLFNNVFWDNRAGTRDLSNVTGLGNLADCTTAPCDYWDMGVADGPGLLEPTNSVLYDNRGVAASLTNIVGSDPLVVSPYDVAVTFNTWRNNPAFLGAIMISADLPPNLMGNYRITNTSPAYNLGAASKNGVSAPPTDIDNQSRPANGGFDAGADEVPGPGGGAQADLSITKTDTVTSVVAGNRLTYTIVVHNGGPSAVTGATVTDTMAAALTGVTWTCSPTGGGSSCGGGGGSGTGNINRTINLGTTANNAVTFTVTGTVNPTATGTLENTATVTAPGGTNDPNPSNNAATDIDQILVPLPLPTLTLLDNFNRNNNANLGANWSQPNNNIRLNGNNAQLNSGAQGFAYWNGTTAGGPTYGTVQGAAFTLANAAAANNNGVSLILKAAGGTATAPTSYLRVRANGNNNRVVVEYTTNGGADFASLGFLPVASNIANGDTLTARANANGSVDVWQNGAYLGRSSTSAATGTGRIGMRLTSNAGNDDRVDNFRGGSL